MKTEAPNGDNQNAIDKFYRESMEILQEANIPFLIGGAYAFGLYTGIRRNTKDFDLFLRRDDFDAALQTFSERGYESEKTFPHWLGKIKRGELCIDLIYRAGNGLCEVDDTWLGRARAAQVFGISVKMCAPEELIWMKAFIMERERFDGADIAHLLLSCADGLDWLHLVDRFGSNMALLLSHLVLFGFIYPSERRRVPNDVIEQLILRWQQEDQLFSSDRVCRGTLISRQQYLPDLRAGGFRDARLEGPCALTPEEIAHWTAAID